jgi:hypothetical protein
MAFRKNAPKSAIWFVCLILYALALLAHFRVFHVDSDLATWSWIIGYALLLIATTARRL